MFLHPKGAQYAYHFPELIVRYRGVTHPATRQYATLMAASAGYFCGIDGYIGSYIKAIDPIGFSQNSEIFG